MPACGKVAALHVGDMIIAINGKDVGLMTETGVEIEFEVSGPIMTLIVSRYRFAEQMINRIKEVEASLLNAIDHTVNDRRTLGCANVGSTESESPFSILVTKELKNQLHIVKRAPWSSPPGETLNLCDAQIEPSHGIAAGDTASRHQVEAHHADRSDSGTSSTSQDHPLFIQNETMHEQIQDETTHDHTKPESDMNDGADQAYGNNEGDYCDDRNRGEHPEMNTSGHDQQALKQSDDSQDDEGMDKEDEDMDNSGDENSQGDHDDDGNPALGCVCGKIHGRSFKVFWIQCDDCNSWFNVAHRCVGFTEGEAKHMRRWACRACSISDAESKDSEERPERGCLATDSDDVSGAWPKFVTGKKRRKMSAPKIDPTKKLAVGTMVEVLPEGSYRFGGWGKITSSYFDEDTIDPSMRRYSVNYIINGYTEHDVSAEYVVDRHCELT
jgi:hypothetical protein